MRTLRYGLLALVAATLLGGCNEDDTTTPPPAPPPPPPPQVDNSSNAVILEWDKLLTDNLPGGGSLYTFRLYAMLHIAMFDAVNSIRVEYAPYRLQVQASPSSSAEAAAAQAGHDVLVALVPAATAAFDAALGSRLAGINATLAAQGVEVGKQTAQAVLTWRTNDGAAGPDPAYTPPALPGLWQPQAGQVAAGGRFATTTPFALLTPTQFLPVPPPALNSAQYAAAYQEVYDLGRATSVTRTADQTTLARAIAGVNYAPNPFSFWNTLARQLVATRTMGITETARLFALMDVSLHDSLQTSHTSKYIYGLWRPITAIQHADADANDATVSDLTWTPLIGTPPYPSHSSNIACLATGASRALAKALGSDQLAFQVTWKWTGAAGAGSDFSHQYTALSQLADEAGMARVYGGIHFKFELTASRDSCTRVADYVNDNYMKRR
jgi:hypothetical protein